MSARQKTIAASDTTASWRLVGVDALVVTVLSAVALSPLADAYGGRAWVVAAGGGVVLGLGIVLATRALRWGPLLTGLLAVVTYCLVGPALAVPDDTVAGVVPVPGAIRELLVGTVDGWRNAITLVAPLTSEHHVLVVPLVTALLASSWAGLFLWRSRWPSLAALGLVAAFVAAASFGTRDSELPVERGLVLAVALVVWVRWRALRHVRTSWVRRLSLTAGVVAAASLAGWGITSATAGDEHREVLRDHVDPPLEQLAFKSPLSKYRWYYKEHEDDTMFTIDWLPDGARVRLATMDDFDGVVWNVSTGDAVDGSSAFTPAPAPSSSDTVTVTVAEDYTGPWVPTVGSTNGVELAKDGSDGAARTLLENDETGAVAQIGDVRPGDAYTVAWDPVPADDGSATDVDRSIPVEPPGAKLPQLDKLAQTWIAEAGATSDRQVVEALVQQFRNGYFSNGLESDTFPVPSGHGAKRIANLVADPAQMIGNSEQYASALAFELQTMGIPARVVLGMDPKAKGPQFTGNDIFAWVEVPFEGAGWVTFDPTPPKERRPTIVSEDPQPVPQPNVVQPPVLPKEPAQLDSAPPEGAGQDLASRLWEILWMVLGILWTVLKWALVLSPIWGLLLLKRVRRRRRRRADDPLDRLSGGWREVTDRARDLGTTLPRSHTRYESSVVLADRFPDAALPPLATVADRHLFGPVDPTPDEVDAYWADVDTALRRMRQAVPWWRRPLAWFSPASIPWRQARVGGAARVRALGRRAASTRLGHAVHDLASAAARRAATVTREVRR